jgi:site-specific DNA-methyltransferase (adenine-specific)
MVAGKPSQPRGLSGASRFFYVAKASKSERNLGCEGLDKGEVKHYTKNRRCKICGHQQVSGSPCKCENPEWEIIERPVMKGGNNHPTVKPLKLMEYLCTLTKTPTGGIVLDPFAGSGTTCIAAKKTGRDFIGIEKDKSYCEIANKRIKAIPLKLFN